MELRHLLKASDLRAVEALIDEHFPFDCDVIPIDSHTWAIHGSIPVDGDVILAEFNNEGGRGGRARVALGGREANQLDELSR